MSIGPIQTFVIGFPDNSLFEGRIAEELRRLSDVGQIRIVDAVFVLREGDDVAALSVSDLDEDQRAELRSAVGALIGLGVAGAEGAVAGAELGASVDASAPTAAEVETARQLLAAYTAGVERGIAVVEVGDRLLDRGTAVQAQHVMDLAAACTARDQVKAAVAARIPLPQ